MITEFDTGQGHQQVSRWYQRAQQVDGLTDDRGTCHFHRGYTVMTSGFGKYR